MKIALLTDGIYPYIIGGMQKHSYYLAKYFAQNKVHVELHHCVPYNQPLIEHIEGFSKQELQYITSQCYHFPKPAKYPGHYIKESYMYSKKIFENIKDKIIEFDFIFAQGFSAWYLTRHKRTKQISPKIGIHFHGLEMFQKTSSLTNVIEQFFLRWAVIQNLNKTDFAFSLGANLTNILSKYINKNKILICSNGIDVKLLSNSIKKKDDTIKFLFVGRYERRKGIEELNIVLKEMIKNELNFEFHFIGPVPNNKKVQLSKIYYHGSIYEENKLFNIYDSCDILVCPSWSEGMPTVILEAMARGLAIISTNVGAIPSQISTENGWLIEPGNKKMLYNTMKNAIMMDTKVLAAMKLKSIKKIESNFLWKKVIQNLITNINQIEKYHEKV